MPAGPINTAEDIFNDPHIGCREMFLKLKHPGSDHTGVFAASPIRLGGTPTAGARRAPLLGEHTGSILNELGYNAEEIKKLSEMNIITNFVKE